MSQPVFDSSVLLPLLLVAAGAFLLGTLFQAIGGMARGKALERGGEAAALAVAGALLSRSFVGLVLLAGHGTEAARRVVAWAFLLWPGVPDFAYNVGRAFGAAGPSDHWLASAGTLMTMAMFTGAFVGFMDGMWGIHRWKALGWIAFPLDVTWGLAGSLNGCLFHLFNGFWVKHAEPSPDGTVENRSGVHQYLGGFRFKGTYAVTQGAVMSNLSTDLRDGLFRHERIHVWQNRIFGPLFTLTYLGWMAVMLAQGVVAGILNGRKVGFGIEAWCYYNNPWEAWAYRVGPESIVKNGRVAFAEGDADKTKLLWSDLTVLVVSCFFFTAVLSGFVLVSRAVWF